MLGDTMGTLTIICPRVRPERNRIIFPPLVDRSNKLQHSVLKHVQPGLIAHGAIHHHISSWTTWPYSPMSEYGAQNISLPPRVARPNQSHHITCRICPITSTKHVAFHKSSCSPIIPSHSQSISQVISLPYFIQYFHILYVMSNYVNILQIA